MMSVDRILVEDISQGPTLRRRFAGSQQLLGKGNQSPPRNEPLIGYTKWSALKT